MARVPDAILRRLIAAHASNLVVPFTGAGISAGSCPMWKEMVRGLEQHAGLDRPCFPPAAQPQEIIQRANKVVALLKNRSAEALAEALSSVLASSEAKPPENAQLLATIRWALTVTTNYDDWFYHCFNSRHANPEAPFYAFSKLVVCGRSRADCARVVNSLRGPDNPILWAIQGFLTGCASKADSVSKSDDYKRLKYELVVGHEEYRREAHVSVSFRRAFADVFRNRTFLFIGSNLGEPYLLNLFDEVLELHGPLPHSHYAIVEGGNVDPAFLRDRLQIRCIEFDNGQYYQVTEILDELRRALTASRARVRQWSVSYTGASRTPWEAQFRHDLNIIEGVRPAPTEQVCMAFSVGFKPGSEKLLIGARAEDYIKEHFQITNVEKVKERAGPEDLIWQLSDGHGGYLPACLVVARGGISKLTEKRLSYRDPRIIAPAVHQMLDWAARHDYRQVQSSVLATAKARTEWPPYLSLIEMIRGYATWRNNPSNPEVRLTIHTQDQLIVGLLRSGRLNLSELVTSPEETRFWIRIHRGVSDIQSFLEYAPNDHTLAEVLEKYCLPETGWVAEIIPNPWGTRGPPRDMLKPGCALSDWSVLAAGLFPGSTLRITLPNDHRLRNQ
jgi:hypothetical protein